jgi:hypothetical protein
VTYLDAVPGITGTASGTGVLTPIGRNNHAHPRGVVFPDATRVSMCGPTLFPYRGDAMPDRADHVRTEVVSARGILRRQPSEQWLFSGIYGLVLASAIATALDATGDEADPGADALWVLITALASGAAHGYAHVIAQRASAGGAVTTSRLRSVLAEWPLVAAVLPTVGILLAAVAGWWAEATAVDAALLFNTVALFGLGASAARTAGHGWPSSCRAGGLDMLIGLVIIMANALIH